MCIIIGRNAGFEIPYKKFENAIRSNPHGYGLSFVDNGKLKVMRSDKAPDPEKLYRMVNEELLDKRLMLHLRYTTAGATNMRNAHPFPVLEKDKDGVDIRMCHNGTLSEFNKNGSKESDTRRFVREYVRPIFKRFSKAMDPEELLQDPLTMQLVNQKLTSASVVAFFDSNDKFRVLNPTGNGGKMEDEWYYSNTYSFQDNYREPYKGYGYGSAGVSHYPSQQSPSNVVQYPNRTKKTPIPFAMDSRTQKFTDKFSIKKHELWYLRDDTLKAFIKEGQGYNMLLLAKELLAENYELEKENFRLKMINKNLKKEA